jgi:hypothetical protein
MWEGGGRAKDIGRYKTIPQTTGSQPSWARDRVGTITDYSFDSTSYGHAEWLDGAGSFSIAAIANCRAVASDHALIWRSDTNFSQPGNWGLWFDDVLGGTTDVWQVITRQSTGLVRASTADSSVIAGEWYHVVGTGELGRAHKIYVGGVDATDSTENTFDEAIIAVAENATIGMNGTQDGRSHDGQIALVAVWKRALSSNEIAHWASDPYGPLRRRSLIVGLVPAVSTRRIFVVS